MTLKNNQQRNPLVWLSCLWLTAAMQSAESATPTPAEVRAIAKEAYIYGFPMVDSYRIQHAYFVDRNSPEFKADWNTLRNIPRVYTPEDKAVQTPNSDTPYSMIGMDLRAEPMVLTVPPIEKERYFSIQLIDAYTHNFGYIGSRTTGNDGGSFLIAGPGWTGEVPKGVRQVIRTETELLNGAYRTQLLRPDDLEQVKKIQAGYRAQTLSQFLGTPAPRPAPAVDFLQPLTPETQKSSLEFFNVLNFVLGFCPTHPSETELMARFGRIGLGAGKRMDVAGLAPEWKTAFQQGMADAWLEFAAFKKRLDAKELSSGDLFGTRETLKNNYLYRMAAAVLGIYGNSKQEAMYPMYSVDADNVPLDGSKQYTLRFGPGQLPPVHAFWSLTMYDLPASLLVSNSLNRYLINSAMLPHLQKDPDGGVTLRIQHESPGAGHDSNWLPAPKGAFWVVLRLYWPQADAVEGRWKAPPVTRVK
jgi:hypothetical protein